MDTTMKPYHCPFCPHGWTAPSEEHIDATTCPQCGGEAFAGPFDTDAKINAIDAHVCIRKIWRARSWSMPCAPSAARSSGTCRGAASGPAWTIARTRPTPRPCVAARAWAPSARASTPSETFEPAEYVVLNVKTEIA